MSVRQEVVRCIPAQQSDARWLVPCLATVMAACGGAESVPTRDPSATAGSQNTTSVSSALYPSATYPVDPDVFGDWGWHSTVKVVTPVPGIGPLECTGTIISPHHVITAAGCFPSTSTVVSFFWGGAPDDPTMSPPANVLKVYQHTDVAHHWQEPGTGAMFNVAILQLDRDVRWQVPGWLYDMPSAVSNQFPSAALQVGLGPHNGLTSTFDQLDEHWTTPRSSGVGGSNIATNWLLTDDPASADGTNGTRGGDMGGPLYGWGPAYSPDDQGSAFNSTGLPPGQAMSLVGVYSGTNPWDSFGNRAGYTLIGPESIDFILRAIGLRAADWTNFVRTGHAVASFTNLPDAAACELICAKRPDCLAWDQVLNASTGSLTCTILDQVTGFRALASPFEGGAGLKATTGPCTSASNPNQTCFL